MADHYVNLPLFTDSDYNYSVNLQGQSYVLDFKYNERVQLYFLSLLDAENNPIVLGEGLVPTYPILKDYALFPLTGFFWMEEKADILSEAYKVYPDKIAEYYSFFYIYSDEE